MGYYGRSQYRGDYYRGRGDFYRGARGDFWDDAGEAFGSVVSYIPSAVTRAATKFTDNLLNPGPMKPLFAPLQLGSGPASPSVVIPGVGGGGVKVGKGKKGSRPIEIFGSGSSSRRMNPCNPKALRRALRRTASFMHFAKKYVKLTHPKAHVEMRHTPLKRHHK